MEKCGRAGQDTDDNIIQRMRIACWITKATDTHSKYEYVIPDAFLQQQLLPESASLLRYTYIACLVYINLLKPTGYVMHHQFNIQQLYALPTLYLCFVFI